MDYVNGWMGSLRYDPMFDRYLCRRGVSAGRRVLAMISEPLAVG